HQLHDQYIVEIPVGLRHADAGGDELVQRVNLRVLPGSLLLFAAEARALAHRARLAAAAHLASFLVLRALLEASLAHIAIDLRAANARARAHHIDGGFFAALEGADNFVDDPIVYEGLQACGCLHGSFT